MKLIHCADLHLDSKMQSNLDKEKAKERKHELLNTFSRMVEYAVNEGVSAILICGDLFDTSVISALCRNTVREAIFANPDITFYYLRGNHDSDSFLNSLETIPDNLVLFGEEWSSYALDDAGNVMLYAVELFGSNCARVQNEFAPDPSKVNIVMLHGQEALTEGRDKAELIDIRKFRNKGINYMALGHIHEYKRCELDLNGGVYCYSGALEGRGFDETGEHGFVLLEIDEESKTVKDTFVPFASRKLFDVCADVSGCGETPEILSRVRSVLSETDISSKDLVKVILKGEVSVECEKDTEYIVNSLRDNYYFIKVYDETAIKVDYDSFMLDQSLKGEFVRLIKSAEDIPEESKGEIIRYGLHVIAGGKLTL